jgi:hypothetical protein
MIVLWSIASAALVVALVAWSQARRSAKRLAQVSEMYWELRYQYGELRVQVQRMTGDTPPASPAAPELGPGPVGESFVPLSSLKR